VRTAEAEVTQDQDCSKKRQINRHH